VTDDRLWIGDLSDHPEAPPASMFDASAQRVQRRENDLSADIAIGGAQRLHRVTLSPVPA
jgi:hypothetical protein